MSDDYNFNKFNATLPVRGSEQPAFQFMGLEFSPFSPEDKYRDAYIPDGWEIKKKRDTVSTLQDNRGRTRAIIVKSKDPMMYPTTRIRHARDMSVNSADRARYAVYASCDNGVDKELFAVESQVITAAANRVKHNEETAALEKKCIDFIKENFPKWEDHCAYWDDDL